MAQQTAVEWYYEQTVVQGKQNYYELLEQAKQMEKEQTKHAFIIGGQQGFLSAAEEEYINFEQYYNETYNK